jgi:hypothetical protein
MQSFILSHLLTRAGDETRPVCKACSKKNRPCQWDSPQNKFKSYEPGAISSKSGADGTEPGSEAMDVDGEGEGSMANHPKEHGGAFDRKDSRADSRSEAPSSNTSTSQQSPETAYHAPQDDSARSMGSKNHSDSSLSQGEILPGTRAYSRTPIPLSHDEAVLVHHYTEYLGRWLDCTDATRQFTFGVPGKVKICPVLCHAVLSFAARHRKDAVTAEAAYHRCIALLIDRLNEDTASHDETLLCAIVILRFYEQLSGEPSFLGCEYVLADSSSALYDRLRRREAPFRDIGHLASFSGPPFCRSFGTYIA